MESMATKMKTWAKTAKPAVWLADSPALAESAPRFVTPIQALLAKPRIFCSCLGSIRRKTVYRIKNMTTRTILKYLAPILLGVALASNAADKSDKAEAKPKPYTLKTCPVSDEKLG